MYPEQRQKIEALLQATLERDPRQWDAFLVEACPDDALRGEVALLLEQYRSKTDPLFPPARLNATGLMVNDPTVTVYSPGTQLGPYKIEEMIGAGGMGQVFRGTDTRLGRTVAIKVSHQQFDARFGREARAIASLNHPNICTLHDVGPNYLVMEFVEGETLAARLKRGKIAIPEALRYGSEIAGALAEAHSRGVTHRDLKPANVLLAKNGAKVLDFGLAKLHAFPDDQITQANAVMGTPAYMSPEQADAKPVDTRSDVFSFGILLYEMTTGTRPFQGDSIESLLIAIRNKEPKPVNQRAPDAPPELARLITRCLRKDPERRAQDMAGLKVALDQIREELHLGPHPASTSKKRYLLVALSALAGALVIAGLYWNHLGVTQRGSPEATRKVTMRSDPGYTVPTPTGYVTDAGGNIDLESKQMIEKYAQGLADRHGSQLAVLVVDTLKGQPMDEFSGAVFKSWRIGRANKDDGLLIVLAIRERQSRLQVGRSLEYVFTTEVCNQILADMRPKLRAQQYGEALRDACLTIGSILNGGTLSHGPAP